MTSIAHKAFLDLEASVADRVTSRWNRSVAAKVVDLNAALDAHRYDDARKVVNTLDFAPVMAAEQKYLETIGVSAMLLGASRITPPRQSKIYKNAKTGALYNGVAQFQNLLIHNAGQALRDQALLLIAAREHEKTVGQLVYKSEVSVQVATDAEDFIGLASSLMISRLSSFGYLTEAVDSGVEYYKISAILDDKVCPVCAALDGSIFRISDGVTQAVNVMQADNLDSLRSVAPWPSQKKDNVDYLVQATIQDLVDSGLTLPPYHPWCRCITDTPSQDEIDAYYGTSGQYLDNPDLTYRPTLLAALTHIQEQADINQATTGNASADLGVSTGGGKPTLEPAVSRRGNVIPTSSLFNRLLGDMTDLKQKVDLLAALLGISAATLLGQDKTSDQPATDINPEDEDN